MRRKRTRGTSLGTPGGGRMIALCNAPNAVADPFFFFQAEDGIRDYKVTVVQTCALPISCPASPPASPASPRGIARSCTPRSTGGEEIGRASCRERGVDLGGRRINKK